jgi:hypothetical protein
LVGRGLCFCLWQVSWRPHRVSLQPGTLNPLWMCTAMPPGRAAACADRCLTNPTKPSYRCSNPLPVLHPPPFTAH